MTENSGEVTKLNKEEKNSDINPAIKEEIKKMEDENKENIGDNIIEPEKAIDKDIKKPQEEHKEKDKEIKSNEKAEEENKPNEGESKEKEEENKPNEGENKTNEVENKPNEESNKKDENNKDENKKEEEFNKSESKAKEEEEAKHNEENKDDNKDDNKMKVEEETKKIEEEKKEGDNKEADKKEEDKKEEENKEENKDENKDENKKNENETENNAKEDEAKKSEEENKDKTTEETKKIELPIDTNGLDIQNLLNSDKQNINELLEVLVQDKDFMSEFLKTEQQQNLLGKKTEREEKQENNNDNNKDEKDNTKANEHKNDLDKFDEFNMNINNDFMLDDLGGHDHFLDEKEDKDKEKEDDDEEDFSYNRLLKLVKQNGINKVLKILTNILNKSDFVYKKVDDEIIKEEIIDITKTIRKDVLFLYIMRIIANVSNNNNINNLSPLIPLLDNKKEPIVKKKIFKPMRLDHPERFDKDNSDNFDKKDKFDDKKELSDIKKQTGEVEYQYRWKHFHWKHGKLYCYSPRNKIRNSKCFLYCSKPGCDAKVQIDMVIKRALFIGNHYEHEGIEMEKYINEYPGIDTKDWKHLQYDCYHGKKILMWKY